MASSASENTPMVAPIAAKMIESVAVVKLKWDGHPPPCLGRDEAYLGQPGSDEDGRQDTLERLARRAAGRSPTHRSRAADRPRYRR